MTSEMAHSLAQKLLGCESVSERYFITSLQWYWQPWEQILCLQRFQCDLCDSFAKFEDEFQGFAVPRSSTFYGNWYEVVRGGEGVVFCGFVGRRLVRRSSGTPSCFTDVRCGICVWDSDVPSERFSTLPRNKSCTIWSLPVGSWEPDWFVGGRYLSSLDRSPYQVIQLRVPYMCWSTFPQNSPCSPLASTVVSQMHMWGWHVVQPSLKPTATRTASLDRRRPIAGNGGTFNQSPACGAATALSLALSAGVTHLAWRSI